MKWLALVAILASLVSGAQAQDDTYTLDDLLKSANDWAEENLDDNVLKALRGENNENLTKLLADIRKKYAGDYIVDLAALKDAAKAAIPLLEANEETAPYASWLRAQLDYLIAADEFRLLIPAPQVEPGQPARKVPNPTPQQQVKVWAHLLEERPWPARAKTLVPRLKPVFAGESIPPDLVWLAEVESAFDPRARSPVGAAGLFQLMPATAKRFGLSRFPSDERYDPEASARAAAQYLHYLHLKFKDWRLALAAYNAGEGTVQRAMEKHSARTFDTLSPHLPAETQMYVPRIEATILRREGTKLREL